MYHIEAKGIEESDDQYRRNPMFKTTSSDGEALQAFVDDLSTIMVNTSFRVVDNAGRPFKRD